MSSKNVIELSEDAEVVEAQVPTKVEQTSPPPSASDALNADSLMRVMENYVDYYASGQGHTARAKRYDLQYFLEHLANASSRKPETVKVADWTMQATKDYIDYRLNLGEAPATVSRRLATIKHFGRTLAERVSGFINPAREVKSPGIDMTRPKGMTIEENSNVERCCYSKN